MSRKSDALMVDMGRIQSQHRTNQTDKLEQIKQFFTYMLSYTMQSDIIILGKNIDC